MKTILLIDDDEAIRTVLGRTLQHYGYRVILAASGKEGLEVARQQLPDLILTDFNMPEMDGQAVLNQIRQDPALSNRQVVLMTGDPKAITPRKGMESGADDFLLKPVGMEDLLRCVEARLKRAQIHWRVEDRMFSELRSSLPSNLPHEFFTPLAGIIGLTDILRSDVTMLSLAEIQDLHNDIHKSALRLHRTLKNYLMILDLQTAIKDTVRAPELLSPAKVKEAILHGVETAARRNDRIKDIVYQVEEFSIVATAGDLSLIVEELVDNACQYSRPDTSITVQFGDSGTITVIDMGRGMTPEEIEQIGAFQQFDRKKHAQQGLGLGLVLVQKLAARCGAKLVIESQPSHGTQAKVVFKTKRETR